MAISAPNRREAFDFKRDFQVARPFIIGGVRQEAGKPFDKQSTTLRKLRQLFDQRYLRVAPATAPQTASEAQAETPISLMDVPELIAWIKGHGAIVRRKATRAQLLLQAETILVRLTELPPENAEGNPTGQEATAEAA